jgi:hypothetical protein
MDDLLRAIQGVADRQAKAEADSRARRNARAEESAYVTSATSLIIVPCSRGRVRITHILAYCASASTLQLRGSAGAPTFVLNLPAGLSDLALGTDHYGGIELDAMDYRVLSTSGAAGAMACLLTGEKIADQYQW